MTLALALAALGYLLGWLAGQASEFRKALEELDEAELVSEDNPYANWWLEEQRKAAPWQ